MIISDFEFANVTMLVITVRNLTMTLAHGLIRTWRLPLFSALLILLRISAIHVDLSGGTERFWNEDSLSAFKEITKFVFQLNHHFTFLPAIFECSNFSSLTTFNIVIFFDCSHYGVFEVVLICISLMTYNVEHLLKCLFAICLSS